MLESELQKIGLSEKEAKVYLSALELGPSPVQKIASKAKVNRATTYVILEGLMKKGVITTFDQGKKRLFVAEGPHTLKNVIHQQQEELNKKEQMLEGLMPQLMSVHNLLPNKPVVRFFEGKEGLKAIQNEFLETHEKEAQAIYAAKEVEGVFSSEEMQAHREKRLKKGIHFNAIYCDRRDEKLKMEMGTLVRVPEEKFPFSSDITIAGDKVMIASLTGALSGVIIDSKSIADTLRSVFHLAWKGAESYDAEFQKKVGKEAVIDKNSL